MNKRTQDHMVAVLVSPGYGAGWCSWGDDDDQKAKALFCPEIVDAVLRNASEAEIEVLAEEHIGEYFFTGGARDLTVEWLPAGTKFRIHEYDGWEGIVRYDEEEWFTA